MVGPVSYARTIGIHQIPFGPRSGYPRVGKRFIAWLGEYCLFGDRFRRSISRAGSEGTSSSLRCEPLASRAKISPGERYLRE